MYCLFGQQIVSGHHMKRRKKYIYIKSNAWLMDSSSEQMQEKMKKKPAWLHSQKYFKRVTISFRLHFIREETMKGEQ